MALNIDHVNYLIWRYLQESGLGHTAIQLMREWHQDPQKLPFAAVVKPHELVSVIQDGLAYDELSSTVQSLDKRYVFNQTQKQSTPERIEEPTVEAEHLQSSRQQPMLERHGSVERRKRKSAQQQVDDDAMEIDDAATPANFKVEEPPLVSTASIGEDKGIQSEEIYEPAVASTVATINLPGADVLNLVWDRSDRGRLIATGGRIWQSFEIPAAAKPSDLPITPGFENHGVTSVFASAIDESGTNLALGLGSGNDAKIVKVTLADDDQKVITRVSGTVVLVRWSRSAEYLMFAAQTVEEDSEGSEHSVSSNFAVFNVVSMSSPDVLSIERSLEDAAWIEDDFLIICGESLLQMFRITPNSIEAMASIETNELWTLIRYDHVTRSACCVSPREGYVTLVGTGEGQFRFVSEGKHAGHITGAEWQPVDKDAMDDSASEWRRLLATSSTDGTVAIWNGKSTLHRLRTFDMDADEPAVALAFSPNGKYIAAAGDDKVCIWAVNEDTLSGDKKDKEIEPVVIWRPAPEQSTRWDEQEIGWPEDDGPFHVLCWKPDGTMLAYSTGNAIAVIAMPNLGDSVASALT